MITDPVGDFIVRLTNAGAVKKPVVVAPFSALKYAIALKLKDRGYVADVEKKTKQEKSILEVTLSYSKDGLHKIAGVKRVSKPGRRLYMKAKEIRPVKYGKGSVILSTPAGILTGDEARKNNVGGETLFEIW